MIASSAYTGVKRHRLMQNNKHQNYGHVARKQSKPKIDMPLGYRSRWCSSYEKQHPAQLLKQIRQLVVLLL